MLQALYFLYSYGTENCEAALKAKLCSKHFKLKVSLAQWTTDTIKFRAQLTSIFREFNPTFPQVWLWFLGLKDCTFLAVKWSKHCLLARSHTLLQMRPAKRAGKQIINNLMKLNLTSVKIQLVANVWYGFTSFELLFWFYSKSVPSRSRTSERSITTVSDKSSETLNYQLMF